jgi:DNA invertase Pin-like site-specific DNA recombinase
MALDKTTKLNYAAPMNTTGALIPYMRKSSGEDPEGSLARQRGAIRRWAEANGLELAPEVWEPHVSGKTSWRERGLGEAIDRVARGEASGIIVEEQSRLSRENMRATAEVWEALGEADARLVCTAEGLDTASGDHELSFTIKAALAREQWKQYARRMADMKARKIEAGIIIGPTPVGYRKRADKRIELDPETAPAIRELYERWAAGEGRLKLAAFLDERAPRPRGRWSRQAIPAIIASPLYKTGRLHYGDLVSEWSAEPIVDEALWAAAQRAPAPPRPRSPHWLLSGLAICGTCGRNLTPSTTRAGGPKRYRYYRCTNRSCDAHRSAPAEKLEADVLNQLWTLLGSRVRTKHEAPDLKPLEEAVSVAERRLEHALTPEVQDAAGDGWAAMIRERRAEHEDALAALGEARAVSAPEIDVVDLRERWEYLTPQERRESLRVYALEYVEVRGPEPKDWVLGLR